MPNLEIFNRLRFLSKIGFDTFKSSKLAFNGLHATMWTYDQQGREVDRINGDSFRVTRDEDFDTGNSVITIPFKGQSEPDKKTI